MKTPDSGPVKRLTGGFCIGFLVACVFLLIARPVFNVSLGMVATMAEVFFGLVALMVLGVFVLAVAVVAKSVKAGDSLRAERPVMRTPAARWPLPEVGWSPYQHQVIDATVVEE